MSLRRKFARWKNPHNLTRLHLAGLVRAGRARVGDYSYGLPKVRFSDGAALTIGRFCSFADQIEIFLGGNHRLDFATTYPFHMFGALWPGAGALPSNVCSRGDVSIGSDVWVGAGVRILSGVAIGHGAAIGAGAVVVRDVPPYAVVTGNPARVVRYRFPEAIIARLVRTAWWDRPDDEIRTLMPLLQGPDIEALLARLEAQ